MMIKKLISTYFITSLFLTQFAYVLAHNPNTVVATINVGVNPAGIAITPDNRFVYVANSGSNSVSVINVVTNAVIKTITGFNTPYSITINPTGTHAYVTNSGTGVGENTISVIDIATDAIVNTITGFFGPDGMVITPDGNFGYVANYGFPNIPSPGTTVSVVNLTTNIIEQQITTGGEYVSTVAITPDGNFVYAANYNTGNPDSGTISVIDTQTNTVVATISGLFGPYTIAIKQFGNHAYVTNFGSNNFIPIGTTASVIDTNNNTIATTINLGNQPAGIAITPDDTLLYATNYNDPNGMTSPGTVNIIDSITNTVLERTITVGDGPGAVAITPNGEYAYVSNYISNTVSVIALSSFRIIAGGTQIRNVLLNHVDLINVIAWTVTGTSLPIRYAIYRNRKLTDLAGIVSGDGPFIFYDYNRIHDVTYKYYIVGINSVGTTSEPVVVTIG